MEEVIAVPGVSRTSDRHWSGLRRRMSDRHCYGCRRHLHPIAPSRFPPQADSMREGVGASALLLHVSPRARFVMFRHE